jgi:hypothetical protein
METAEHDTGFGLFMLGAVIIVATLAVGIFTPLTTPASLGALVVTGIGVLLSVTGLGQNYLAQL